MKPPLLAISLATNVVLVAGAIYLAIAPSLAEVRQSRPAAGPDSLQPTAPTTGATHATSLSLPATLPPAVWQSPAEVDGWLQTANAPLKVRHAVVQFLLGTKYANRYEAIRFPPTMKKWQRSQSRTTPEYRDQQSALHLQQEEEMKQLLGADYPQARYDAAAAAQAGLSVEKYAAIMRVRTDYGQIRMRQGGFGNPAAQQLMDEEMASDLAGILTPEEFELHQAYESREAQSLQQAMTGLDVDDETYLRAYRAAAQARAENPRPNYSPTLREAELLAIEKAAGLEVVRHIAMTQDGNFREFDRIYSQANLTATARYEKYQVLQQFRATLERLQSSYTVPGKLDAAQQTEVRSAYDRLTAGLSPDARAEFNRTSTGAFMARLLALPTP